MVNVKSNKACLLNFCGIDVAPQANEYTDEEYAKLKENESFKALVKSGDIFVLQDMGIETEEKEVSDMNVTELRAYAKSIDLKLPTNATKAEILELITSIEG